MAEKTYRDQPTGSSVEELAKSVENQIASLDPQRAEALVDLERAHAARASGYAREQKRLALKYGADSPRVAALTDKIRVNKELRRDLQFEAIRARVEPPTVDKTSYVFHGFVRDVDGRGVPHLTVALYDENADWIRELGYGCTDEQGYFLMRYESGKRDQQVDPKLPPGLVAADSDRVAISSDSQAAVRIYVLESQTTLQIEKEPLYPQLGQVDFRVILLGLQAAPCAPPPDKPGKPSSSESATSTPLEAIRGIGPEHARKLRAAGIEDVETFLRTDLEKLAEMAGFDARGAMREAEQTLEAKKRSDPNDS